MTGFKTSVRIRRPIQEVFAFVSDPLKFPRWNSAVQSVRKTAGRERQVRSTYSMRRALPSGGVHNDLEIFAWEEPAEFGIRTTSGRRRSPTATDSPPGPTARSSTSTAASSWQVPPPSSRRSRRAQSSGASTSTSPL